MANADAASNWGEVEHEIWEGGWSPKAMFASFAASLLAAFVCLVVAVAALLHQATGVVWTSLLAVALIALAQFSRVAKRCGSARYRLSSRRLFLETGFFSCHKDQLALERVEDVRIRQNIFDRFFDVGSVEILSSDGRLRRIVLAGISGPDAVAEAIRSHARTLRDPRSARPGIRLAAE